MKIGVVGLGTIGIKLIEYLSEKNFEVIAYNYRNIDLKKNKFLKNIERKIKFGKIDLIRYESIVKNVNFSDQLKELYNCQLVIDSSKEDYDVKKNLYEKLISLMDKKAVLATTTSSLNIIKLSKFYDLNRFVALHFFNPPTKMKLIELVFLKNTSLEIRNFIYKFLNVLDDKKVIELPPIQGYVVNRLLFVYINYAIEFMEENNLNPQIIDETMKFGTNVPMGPLQLSDYIGNDVTLEILNEFFESTKDVRFKPAKRLVHMVKENKLGNKTKIGFYEF